MGCAASRPAFDDHYTTLQHPSSSSAFDHHDHPTRSAITMSAPHTHFNPSLHDFNIVPLSSSVYGISMNIPHDHDLHSKKSKVSAGYTVYGSAAAAHPNLLEDESMKEMLQVLDSLDMGDIDPKSKKRDHASSILDDLKPGLEKHFNQALRKPLVAGLAIKPAAADHQLTNGNHTGQSMRGKENAMPSDLLPSSKSMPASRKNGSSVEQAAGAGISGGSSPSTKPLKSKSSFASRFLKRSSSSLGSGKKGGGGEGEGHSAEVETSLNANGVQANADPAKVGESGGASAVGSGSPDTEMRPPPTVVNKKRVDPLAKFEKLCPPGGENSAVLYTTSLRGIRKTFEDCNSVRSILQSFRVSVDERDVAMHQGFRNELREMMGNKPGPVPRLFIKGHHIGCAEEVMQLHEEEQLAPLLEGLPEDQHGAAGHLCDGCGGARFVPCLECSGSCKVAHPYNPREVIRCPDCNENGLIQCPICN